MFSALIVAYLFLGGTGAGATVVLCALEVMDAQRHQGQRRRALVAVSGLRGGRIDAEEVFAPRLPRNFYARAWPIALVSLATGIVCLLFDIGRPDRILAFVTSPELSAVTVGAYALVAAVCVAGTFTGLSLLDGLDVAPVVVRALGIAGVAIGLVVSVYTGVLLQSMASVVLWQTPLLPAVFALSALSCGLACVFAALAFTETRQSLVAPARVFGAVDSALIAAELVALAAFVAIGLSKEGAQTSAQALVSGDLCWLFWGGLVAAGLVVPFVLERVSVSEGRRFKLLWTAGFVLAGGLALRWCVVSAAAYDVTQAVGSFLGLAAV